MPAPDNTAQRIRLEIALMIHDRAVDEDDPIALEGLADGLEMGLASCDVGRRFVYLMIRELRRRAERRRALSPRPAPALSPA